MRKHFIVSAVLSIGFGPVAHAAEWNGPAEFECGVLSRTPDVRMEDQVYKFDIRIERRNANFSISTTTLSGKEVSRVDQYNVLNSAISWKNRVISWAGVDRADNTLVMGGTFRWSEGHWFYKETTAKIQDGVEKGHSDVLAGCSPQDGGRR